MGIFVLAAIVVSQNALASGIWNGASNDCPTASVANFTTNTGIVVPCWPLSTVPANPSQTVNVRIYYHNTSTQNATNVRVLLNAQTGAGSSHAFTGQIVSDQGSIPFGPVNVTTPNTATLSFGSAHWLPNQSQIESPLLNGQSSSAILSSQGLSLGTIAPGWLSQGSVVVAFSIVGQAIDPPLPPTGTLTPANNTCTIGNGKSNCDINFSWNTNNPASGAISAITRDGGTTVATGNSGSKALTVPYGSATFRLYNNALELDSKTVSSSCTSGTSWNGAMCSENVNPNYNCSITNFTVGGALSTTVTSGNSVELAWTTTNCNTVTISSVGSNLPSSGNQSISPSVSTVYTLTGYGNTGTNPTRTVSVTVTPNTNPSYVCSISSFRANDSTSSTTISTNENAQISWNTSNCTSVNIQGIGSGLPSSGNYTVYPNHNTRYTIIASGQTGGTQTKYVDVNVTPISNPSYVCNITDFSASNPYITAGSSTSLNWNTSNCASVSISNLGTVSQSGNQSLSPSITTNYILNAYSPNGGNQTRNVLVTVSPYIAPYVPPYVPPTPVYNQYIVTTVATNIGRNDAQVNGYISNPNYYNSTIHFDYGTSVNLGSSTAPKSVNGISTFSEFLRGLNPNTIYYFQAVGEGSYGTSRGSIEIFRTQGNVVVHNTVVVQGTTVVGTSSPIMLNISNKYELIGVGDLVDYAVFYKNIGKTRLTNPMIQVVIPTNITLINSSRGAYSVDTHTLSAPIEDLNAGQEGVIYLQGRVDSIPLNNSQIATTAILVYTTPNGTQENAMAYVLNRPKIIGFVAGDSTTSDLGASAFFAGFLSIGFIGWLILIIFILLLILIARSLYNRTPENNHSHTPIH